MKGTLNEKKRLKKEKKEEKKTSPPKATTTAKPTTTKKNIVFPAPAAAVSRKTRSSFSAATNVKTPATSTTSIHNVKDSGSKRKKASNKKDNAEKHADPVFGSYDENLLNKMWDEGLGCREHINEYHDFPQHSTDLNTVI